MSISPFDLLNLLRDGGGLAGLVIFLYLIITGKLVAGSTHHDCIPKSIYDEMRRDRDDWKEIAMTGTNAAEKALEQASRRRRQLFIDS